MSGLKQIIRDKIGVQMVFSVQEAKILAMKAELLMSVKLIYVLSSFHMLLLSILYPYSCKTHNISSKLVFVGLLMESM